MALPISIPNTFATETNNIPLSEIDANFTTVANAINGIGSGLEALANVAVTGGTINGAIIGGSNAVAGTFSTLTANAATVTSLTVTTGGGVAPTGSLTMWAGAVASPPTGWLACNGANVSRATYSSLFAVIGTAWGVGDGSTTFTLPNLLNRFPVGAGSTYAINASGGTTTAAGAISGTVGDTALTEAQMPRHFHQMVGPNSITAPQNQTGSYGNYGGGTPDDAAISYGTWSTGNGAASGSQTTGTSSGASHTHSFTGTFTGTSGANLPPYVAVGYIIKT
jgi:microcystin-dependent protein